MSQPEAKELGFHYSYRLWVRGPRRASVSKFLDSLCWVGPGTPGGSGQALPAGRTAGAAFQCKSMRWEVGQGQAHEWWKDPEGLESTSHPSHLSKSPHTFPMIALNLRRRLSKRNSFPPGVSARTANRRTVSPAWIGSQPPASQTPLAAVAQPGPWWLWDPGQVGGRTRRPSLPAAA